MTSKIVVNPEAQVAAKKRGLVLTIDGHLIISPRTDVISPSPDVTQEGPVEWRVANPEYFYDASRGTVLDRTGSFIAIYKTLDASKICTAIILDANITISGNPGIRFLPIRFFGNNTFATLAPSIRSIYLRLEDNFKFCSTIPSWIPANAESLDRWIPCLSSDMDYTIGQKIEIKGGVASIDGLTVPMVYAEALQANNKMDRFFREQANPYNVTEVFGFPSFGEDTYPVVIYDYLSASDAFLKILDRAGGAFTEEIPVPMDARPNYPWVSATTTDLTLDLQEPIFIDTEAISIENLDSTVVDPAGNGDILDFYFTRGIDESKQTSHYRYSVLFNGMPFPIGQTIKLWDVQDMDRINTQSWSVTYRGLLENIVFDEGLAAFSVEISSILWTQRVNAEVKKDSSIFSRVKEDFVVREEYKEWLSRFIFSQINPTDKFRWVKIGEICFPIERRLNLDYRKVLTEGTETEINRLSTSWLIPFDSIPDRLAKNLADGTEDFGYEMGFTDQYGEFQRAWRFNRLSIDFFFSGEVGNIWNIPVEGNNDDPLPVNSTWGYYRVELLKDEYTHTAFAQLRFYDDIIGSEGEDRGDGLVTVNIAKYISEQNIKLVHLFEPFCLGLDQSSLPERYRRFWYSAGTAESLFSLRSLYLRTNVIDVILQVLTSTGTGDLIVIPNSGLVLGKYVASPGLNGPFDLIPSEFGLGIGLDLIDLDSFATVLSSRGESNLEVKSIHIESGQTTLDFLEKQILQPFFLSLATSSDGRIKLIDVADVIVGPGVKTISIQDFVRVKGSRTNVSLSYEADDLADSFSFTWNEPWTTQWISPDLRQSEKILGNAARNATLRIAGSNFVIPARTAIFKNIQSSPIVYDLKYAPYNIDGDRGPYPVVVELAQQYLQRFNRIVPRATFELAWNENSPDIGDKVAFNLEAIPNKFGVSGDTSKLIIGKVIDVKIDRREKVAIYTTLLTDSTIAGTDLLWSITAEILSVDIPNDEITVSVDKFAGGYSAIFDEGVNAFQNDVDQFEQGDTIIIWDQNWRFIDSCTILSKTGNTLELSITPSSGWVDYRITLETKNNYFGIYRDFLAWLNTGQKLL